MRKKGQQIGDYNKLKMRITVSVTLTPVKGIDAIHQTVYVLAI